MLGGPPFHGFYPLYPLIFTNVNIGERVPLVNRQVPTVAAGVWDLPIQLSGDGAHFSMYLWGKVSFGSLACLLFAAMARLSVLLFSIVGSLPLLLYVDSGSLCIGVVLCTWLVLPH